MAADRISATATGRMPERSKRSSEGH
jgi:hypothetical protein